MPVTLTDLLQLVSSLPTAQPNTRILAARAVRAPIHTTHRFEPYPPPVNNRSVNPVRQSAYPQGPSSPISQVSSPIQRCSSPIQQYPSSPMATPISSGFRWSVPKSIYNPQFALDDKREYRTERGGISYRKLIGKHAARTARVCLDKINAFQWKGHQGPQAVLRKLASAQDDFSGICIYHTALNVSDVCEVDTFHCSGPMGSKDTDYYLKYRATINIPTNLCFKCWTPTNETYFRHPREESGVACSGRDNYEDLYRGIPYIIFRCSVIRKLVFEWLGSPGMADTFQSTTDWVRWLEQPTSRSFVTLRNFLTLTWAFISISDENGLPEEALSFDGM